jgi:hypothetical protein
LISSLALLGFVVAVNAASPNPDGLTKQSAASGNVNMDRLPPRNGGTLILQNLDTAGAFGLFDINYSTTAFGIPFLGNGVYIPHAVDLASTERWVTRYLITTCADIVGDYELTLQLWSANHGSGALFPLAPLHSNADCVFTGTGSGNPGVDFNCQQFECKPSTPTFVPDPLGLEPWFDIAMFSDVSLDDGSSGENVFALIPADPFELTIGFSADLQGLTTQPMAPPWDLCCLDFIDPDLVTANDVELYASNFGSCCLPDHTCVEIPEADCTAAGGNYAGDFSDCSGDLDGDGVAIVCDNCEGLDASNQNPGQEDCDGDCVFGDINCGDVCDPEGDADADGDGVCENVDNCPGLANAGQENSDGDSHGDACDNCPADDNEGQEDADGDDVGDACDPCPNDAPPDDDDSDGVCDSDDVCPGGDDNADADGDGVADFCDPCTGFPNVDGDGDGLCDSSDPCVGDSNVDTDGDGVCDENDPCPADANDDSDGDGSCDSDDICPGEDDGADSDPADGVPDCVQDIPTVSEWGLVILTLLLLTAWKVYFGRRQAIA